MQPLSLHKSFLAFLFVLLVSNGVRAQSESHNFITYDTTIHFATGTAVWTVRISRPVNYFTPGSADTASRPWILTMPGSGEVGTDTNYLHAYGPHYWIQHGWDGGVQLENGRHYPILITVIGPAAHTKPVYTQTLMDTLIRRYHPRAGSLHLGGLSMGVEVLGWYVGYEATAGDEHNMANVRSFVDLQGEGPSDYTSPVNNNPMAYPTWLGHWAKQYGGKFFGLEGTQDTRKVWQITQNMNDSVAGSAYFSFEKIGGGSHCCWNDMYDPSRGNWRCLTPVSDTAIATNRFYPNTLGTYFFDTTTGSSIFQWMLRQGDTTLIGGAAANVAPVAHAGNDTAITLPIDSLTLYGSGTDADGVVVSYAWAKLSGTGGTIVSPSSAATQITGLSAGVYQFVLTVTDNLGATGSDTVQVTVNAANIAPVAHAGNDTTITLPVDSLTLAGSGTDADGTIAGYAWTKLSGTGGTIVSPSSATTQITGLSAGVYLFVLTVTDNLGATGKDTVQVTVNAAASGDTLKAINVQVYGGTNAYSNTAWNNWNAASASSFASLKYADGTTSAYSVARTVYGTGAAMTTSAADNGSTYGSSAGSTMAPTGVLRYAGYSTVSSKLTFTGLDTSKYYDLSFYASRNNTTGLSTKFWIGSDTVTIVTDTNYHTAAAFTHITPNASGVIVVAIDRSSGSYNYLNGFTLTEAGHVSGAAYTASTVAGRVTSLVAGDAALKPLLVYPNPGTSGSITIYFKNALRGKAVISLVDAAGVVVRTIQVQKNEDVYNGSLPVDRIGKGLYFVKVAMSGYTETKKFIRL